MATNIQQQVLDIIKISTGIKLENVEYVKELNIDCDIETTKNLERSAKLRVGMFINAA
jgi:hypothetical protein